jgi:peptidoglycan/LPS O-acetylase OafA/YrhL
MSIPVTVVGAFVGPTILLAGLCHAGLGTLFFLSRRWLLEGKRWVKWVLIAVSVFGITALPVALLQKDGLTDQGDFLVFPSIISVLGALMLFLAARIKSEHAAPGSDLNGARIARKAGAENNL